MSRRHEREILRLTKEAQAKGDQATAAAWLMLLAFCVADNGTDTLVALVRSKVVAGIQNAQRCLDRAKRELDFMRRVHGVLSIDFTEEHEVCGHRFSLAQFEAWAASVGRLMYNDDLDTETGMYVRRYGCCMDFLPDCPAESMADSVRTWCELTGADMSTVLKQIEDMEVPCE